MVALFVESVRGYFLADILLKLCLLHCLKDIPLELCLMLLHNCATLHNSCFFILANILLALFVECVRGCTLFLHQYRLKLPRSMRETYAMVGCNTINSEIKVL